jgi:hypothetical protein
VVQKIILGTGFCDIAQQCFKLFIEEMAVNPIFGPQIFFIGWRCAAFY